MTDQDDLDSEKQLDLTSDNWVSEAEHFLKKQPGIERFWISSRKEKFLSIDFDNIKTIPSYVKGFDGLEVRIKNSTISDNFIGDRLKNCRHLWFINCNFQTSQLSKYIRNVEYLLIRDSNYEIWQDNEMQNYNRLHHITMNGNFQIDHLPIFDLKPIRSLSDRKSITVDFDALGIPGIRKTAAIYRLAGSYPSLRASKWEITIYGKGDQFKVLSQNRYNRSRSDKSCTFYLHELLDIVTNEFIE